MKHNRPATRRIWNILQTMALDFLESAKWFFLALFLLEFIFEVDVERQTGVSNEVILGLLITVILSRLACLLIFDIGDNK